MFKTSALSKSHCMRILLGILQVSAKYTMTDGSVTTESLILELIPKSLKVQFTYTHDYCMKILNHFNRTN